VFKGSQIRDAVEVLLEKSGYSVSPYGYERTLSDIRKKLNQKISKNSRTARRIRSSPDLLVYDDQKNDVMLVEVKMRNAFSETKVFLNIGNYKEFWEDSILLVVVPLGNVFYAQIVNELEDKEEYNLNRDFLRIEEIFTRIKSDDVLHYKEQVVQIMKKS
jgi:hypothetical protein